MNNKKNIKIILVIIILFFISISVYFMFGKEKSKSMSALDTATYYISSDSNGNLNFKTTPSVLSPKVQNRQPKSLNTIYQNLSTLSLYVSVCDSGATAIHSLNAFVDNVNPPLNLVCSNVGGPLLTGGSVFFIVLPNYFYKVISTDVNSIVNSWIEWS